MTQEGGDLLSSRKRAMCGSGRLVSAQPKEVVKKGGEDLDKQGFRARGKARKSVVCDERGVECFLRTLACGRKEESQWS